MTSNESALILAGLAIIATMPEELPPPVSNISVLAWAYKWLHDAAKAFVSFRLPQGGGGR